jgi:hypothetical protein
MKTDDLYFTHPFSYKTGMEKVSVSVYRLRPKVDNVTQVIFTLALSGIEEFLAPESEKYTQKYKGNVRVIDFFNNDGTLKYDGISIEREVQLEKTNSYKNLAAVFSFSFETPDNDKKMFRLVAKKPTINFSKCKTSQKKGTVNASVKWGFEAVWLADGEPKRKAIYQEEFDFHDVKLTGINEIRDPEKQRNDFPSSDNHETNGSWISFFPDEAVLNIHCEIVESDETSYGNVIQSVAAFSKDCGNGMGFAS